jgi:hypothetical protein
MQVVDYNYLSLFGSLDYKVVGLFVESFAELKFPNNRVGVDNRIKMI